MSGDIGRIREALQFIPATDRDTWLRMGMAIKSELGDTGFDLWDEWSQQADSYDTRDARDVWKSIRASGKVTIRTLFHEAKANGWRDDGIWRLPTPEELAERKRVAAEHAAQEEAKVARERADTATKAAVIWKAATEAKADHPYLVHKQIFPVATLREIDASAAEMILGYAPKSDGDALAGRLLVVPVKKGDTVSTLELIDGDGHKAALAGRGTKVGGYWASGQLPNGDGDGLTLLIGEGVATGLSGTEACGHTAIASLSASNLPAVAKAMRKRYPTATLVMLADLVKATGEPDPHAVEAARSVGGKLAIPDFGAVRPDGAKDFNDMAQRCGTEAVGRAIAGATAPAGEERQADKKKASAGEPAGGYRREPEPLRASLKPADSYPVASLGPVLGDATRAIHETVKAPLAMCCQSVLAAASLAAQAHFDVVLPWGNARPLSLFLLTVGESGERKSGVDDVVLGAAKKQERTDMEAYQPDLEQYEAELDAWKQAVDAAKRSATSKKEGKATSFEVFQAIQAVGERPTPPVMPLRFLTDPTIEGQFKLMAIAQPSVGLFSDEGGLLIGGHALNSDNALKTMARWCKTWDGAPFDRVRAGDGAAILYGRRMAMHQLAQPDVMTLLLSDRMANGQGLLSRCLVAWPESTIGTRQIVHFERPEDRREANRLFAVLKTLMEAKPPTGKSVQELDPVRLPLSTDAAQLAVAALNQFEALMAPGADLAELRDRTSKALENACRIAGVMTVIDHGLSAREIDRPHLERALILMQWYLREALRIRGASAIPQSVSDAETLSAWLKERGHRLFRTQQVLNAGPSQLRNKPRLMAAIKELETNGYLVQNDPGTLVDGVRTRMSWTVLHHVV